MSSLTYPQWCFYMGLAFLGMALILKLVKIADEFDSYEFEGEYEHYHAPMVKDSDLQ